MKLFIAAALVLHAAQAQAETYPSRPITIVVPTTAGGPPDTLARLIAEPMRSRARPAGHRRERLPARARTLGSCPRRACRARRLHAQHRPSQLACVFQPDLFDAPTTC